MAEHQAEENPEGRAVTQSEEWAMARSQQILAVDGLAEGQCGYCGVYRLDGHSPILHRTWCAAPHLDRTAVDEG